MRILIVLPLLALFAIPVEAASLRCPNGMISENEHDLAEVFERCGPPLRRERQEPPPGARPGAVVVEHWVYASDGGMYRHLKFIEGRLVQIRSERGG